MHVHVRAEGQAAKVPIRMSRAACQSADIPPATEERDCSLGSQVRRIGDLHAVLSRSVPTSN